MRTDSLGKSFWWPYRPRTSCRLDRVASRVSDRPRNYETLDPQPAGDAWDMGQMRNMEAVQHVSPGREIDQHNPRGWWPGLDGCLTVSPWTMLPVIWYIVLRGVVLEYIERGYWQSGWHWDIGIGNISRWISAGDIGSLILELGSSWQMAVTSPNDQYYYVNSIVSGRNYNIPTSIIAQLPILAWWYWREGWGCPTANSTLLYPCNIHCKSETQTSQEDLSLKRQSRVSPGLTYRQVCIQ